jgi:hypothetical protein
MLFAGLILLPLLVFAQGTEGDGIFWKQLDQSHEVFTVPELKTLVEDKIDFRLEAGTAFTSFGRRGSIFDSYIAPEIGYRASPRVHFSTGIVLSTGYLSGPEFESPGTKPGGSASPLGNRFNRILIFAEGNYQINPRLTIGGMVVKELDNNMYRDMNAFQKNSGFQSVGMNLNYKITDNFHVGARFNMTNGRPYYYNDPANPFMQRSPFRPGW